MLKERKMDEEREKDHQDLIRSTSHTLDGKRGRHQIRSEARERERNESKNGMEKSSLVEDEWRMRRNTGK